LKGIYWYYVRSEEIDDDFTRLKSSGEAWVAGPRVDGQDHQEALMTLSSLGHLVPKEFSKVTYIALIE